MTHAIWRQYTAVFCTFLMIAAPITLPGCDMPGEITGDGLGDMDDGGSITLSSSRSAPGQFLTIAHPSIANGATVEVDFVSPDGFSMTSTTIAKQDGSVRLMAPPAVDQAGAIGAGVVTVSLRGITSTTQLEITELPSVGALAPGAALRALYDSVVEDHRATLVALATIEADFGSSEDLALGVSEINERIAILEDRISQIDANGALDLGESELGPLVLSSADLAVADQLIVAVLNGALEEQQLEPLDLIGTKSATRRQQTIEERQEERDQNVREAIRILKGTPALGFNYGTAALGVVSLALMAAGLIVSAPTAAYLGAIGVIFAGGDALYSFATAPLVKTSTNAFNNNNGLEYDASQQLLIEVTGQALGNKAAEIGRAYPQTAGHQVTFIGATQTIVKVTNAILDVKCMERQMAQPPKINQQLTDVGEFCEVVRPTMSGADDDDSDNGSPNLCNGVVCDSGVCDPLSGDCETCVEDQDCVDLGSGSFCRTTIHVCDECRSDQDCIDLGLGFVCDIVGNCNDCASDQDCLDQGLLPICGALLDCVDCAIDDDCRQGQRCDRFFGTCVSANRCDGVVCDSGVCDPLFGDCVDCVENQDCIDQGLGFVCAADFGICDECESDQDCLDQGLLPRCSELLVCVECLDEDDCQDGQVCDGFDKCVNISSCNLTSSELNEGLCCTAEDCESGLVCDEIFGECAACFDDDECPAGQLCDFDTGRCIPN